MFHAIRYRSTELALKSEMLQFIGTVILNRALPYCEAEFTYPMFPYFYRGEELPIQVHWLFYDWVPPGALWRTKARKYAKGTVAEAFLAAQSKSLNDEEKEVLRSTVGIPSSFYKVLQSKQGRWVELEDLFLGSRIKVEERDMAEYVRTGRIIFGRVVPFRTTMALAGVGRACFTSGAEKPILEFKGKMRNEGGEIQMEDIMNHQDMLRGLYFRMKYHGTKEDASC